MKRLVFFIAIIAALAMSSCRGQRVCDYTRTHFGGYK